MEQQIHLVTGKGGVGKSTVARALAQKLSAQGPTLLAQLLGHSDLQAKPRSTRFNPVPIANQLDAADWDGTSCLREFVRHYLKLERLVDLFFENRIMQTFVRVAPGLRELALLGKVTSGIRKIGPALNYRHIVVDCFSTGHFEALLKVPKGMANIVRFGPMGEQCRSILEVISNPKFSKIWLVTLPEEMPTKEAAEFFANLKINFNQNLRLVCNRVLTPPFSNAELLNWQKAEEKIRQAELADFLTYLMSTIERQAEFCQQLHEIDPLMIKVEQFFSVTDQQLVQKMSEVMELR